MPLGMRLVPGWLEKSFFDQLEGMGDTAVSPTTLSNALWTLLLLLVGVELSRMVADIAAHWASAKVRMAGQSLMRQNVMRQHLWQAGGCNRCRCPPGT
jgi:hypothetical protein